MKKYNFIFIFGFTYFLFKYYTILNFMVLFCNRNVSSCLFGLLQVSKDSFTNIKLESFYKIPCQSQILITLYNLSFIQPIRFHYLKQCLLINCINSNLINFSKSHFIYFFFLLMRIDYYFDLKQLN